jgi:hypothetical protein
MLGKQTPNSLPPRQLAVRHRAGGDGGWLFAVALAMLMGILEEVRKAWLRRRMGDALCLNFWNCDLV